jgi:hypothetical protein
MVVLDHLTAMASAAMAVVAATGGQVEPPARATVSGGARPAALVAALVELSLATATLHIWQQEQG